VEPSPPSAAGLAQLTRRQVERVPYETMWIAAGEAWSIDPHEAARRIALEDRGGYCYHLNGALGLLLGSLGYSVQAHVGGVHGSGGPDAEAVGNHLVLTVDRLPTDENPGGVWYVDAGLGDALYDPLPLLAGAYRQEPFGLSLERTDTGWHLSHDPSGGFAGMSWSRGTARMADFEEKHRWLSSAPDSGFVKVPMAERREASGVDVVRCLTPMRIGDGAFTGQPVTDRCEWFDLLADLFGLRFEYVEPEARERLWTTVLAAHRRWEAEHG
jgi:arylamine N-acetyltransferase